MLQRRQSADVILDTGHSPFARLKPVPISDVELESGFWYTRLLINQNVTLPSQYKLLESTGRLDNFLHASGNSPIPFRGYVFNDSDVYKWLEAASWTLSYDYGSELPQYVDNVIKLIIQAQQRDGYINTYFSMDKAKERWTKLTDKHELYCAGHLIQAAIAHNRTTGKNNLLDCALRFADHIYSKFGPGKREGTCGHPEIEMALIELYRTVHDQKYLELASLLIERRGRGLLGGREYLIDHLPFRNLERLAGHAVRALYLCSGITDLYLEMGEDQLFESLERVWQRFVRQQMYITGGAGSRHDGEAFGNPYELPNANAYAETCAAIASVMWNWRMLQRNGNASYADLFEWTLYNAVLPGISLDGKQYFYVNPLSDEGDHRRELWFDCACCPPNISRMIASLRGYIYGVSDEGIWLHMFIGSHATIQLSDGYWIGIKQCTSYPWDGHVKIEITSPENNDSSKNIEVQKNRFSLFIRIPGWLGENNLSVIINNTPEYVQNRPSSYLELSREWETGDLIEIYFPMVTQYYEAHPSVIENAGRVAITRGPLVYCLEAADNPGISLSNIAIDPSKDEGVEKTPELMDGLVALRLLAKLSSVDDDWNEKLYRRHLDGRATTRYSEKYVQAIPYFAWANRSPGSMRVWHQKYLK